MPDQPHAPDPDATQDPDGLPSPPADDGSRTLPMAFGRFLIRDFLGEGSFGAVYRAHDPQLDREVALKVAKPGAVSPKRFRAEARASADLRHPYIVPLFEAGEADGQPYFASAFVPGRTLEDALHERQTAGGFAPREAAKVARKLADALAYAHGQGVIHRDVKSANVILDAQGDPHLLDFGLALRVKGAERMTQDGRVLGTPAYLAPEAARGDRDPWGPATDQYALGVVLYEMLAGQTPFAGPMEVVLFLHQTREPERPSKRNPAVPGDLEAVCLKCLDKDPAKRYPDCRALAEDLRRFLDGRPTVARPLWAGERLRRWARRQPAQAGLAAAAVLLVATLVGAGFVVQHQQLVSEHAREAREQEATAERIVDALATANMDSVPVYVRALDNRRREHADPLLRAGLATMPEGSPVWLRFALGLLRSKPELAGPLVDYLPRAKPEEVPVIRDALKDQAETVAAALWPRLTAGPLDAGPRLRLAGVLAGYRPADARWEPLVPALAADLVRQYPLELAVWAPTFDPLARPLADALRERYRVGQARLKSGDLDTPQLVAAAGELDLAATLLARYAADRPDLLADLLLTADARHFGVFFDKALAHRPAVVRAMHEALGPAPAAGEATVPDSVLEQHAIRQAHAAAALLKLGDAEPAWPLLKHSPDPTARSHLIHAAAARGVDPRILMQRYGEEPDVSARRALVLALGDYDAPAKREAFVGRLLGDFREHPDAGLHGAIDWLLRQRWGQAAALDDIVAEARAGGRGSRRAVSARGSAGASPSQAADSPGWLVNGQGQTYTLIRGPVEFVRGSPPEEPGREDGEGRRPTTIGHSFAIAAREVTAAEYLRFNKDYRYRRQYAPEPDGPIDEISWYEAAAYCRWLSEREGVPEGQMCYPPVPEIKPGMTLPADFLSRTGYRLPTEAEWEYACRAGAVTARPYGRGVELLGRYGWFIANSQDHLWPCGRLKPNDFGLFDTLGNAWEWCQDAAGADGDGPRPVTNDRLRLWCGGSFIYRAPYLRASCRKTYRPDDKGSTVGFRPARTCQ